jgi:RHS repeat-associated protein
MLRTINEGGRKYCRCMKSWRGRLVVLLAILLQAAGPLFPSTAAAQTQGAPYELVVQGTDQLSSIDPSAKYTTADAAIQSAENALVAQYGTSIPGQTTDNQGNQVNVICTLQIVRTPITPLFQHNPYVAKLYYWYPSHTGFVDATCDSAGTNGGDVGEIFVTVSNVGYDIGKNLGGCDCTGGNGASDNGSRPSDGSEHGNVVSGNGPPSTPLVSDPIHTVTGNKFQQDTDFLASPWLTFRRFYNSGAGQTDAIVQSTLGPLWRHSFDRSLSIQAGSTIRLYRPDGRSEQFQLKNGIWTPDADVADTLTEHDDASGSPVGYTVFMAAPQQFEQYSSAGLLQSITDESGQTTTLTYSTALTPTSLATAPNLLLTVTDPQGRQLNFSYGSSGSLAKVVQPDGGTLTYAYDTSTGNLTSVQYPDGKNLQYVYNESTLNSGTSQPSALTGIIDEAGVRYVSTGYDSSSRAISTSFAGGIDAVTIDYGYDPGAGGTVTTPLGFQYNLITQDDGFGARKVQAVKYCGTQSCSMPFCGPSGCNSSTSQYDSNGYPSSVVDFNSNQTSTTYSSAGLLTQKIEAKGTSNQRTTNLTWNANLRVPLTRTVLDASGATVTSTAWVYNTSGQLLAHCEIDPNNSAASSYTCAVSGTVPAGVRRWAYTYCTVVDSTRCPIVGLMLTATGPRTDTSQTTTYSYYLASSATNCGTPGAACYQPGDLHTITDPLGHITTIASYDANGRPTRATDANGVITDLTYTPRGWLASRTVGGARTSFTYTAYGALQSVTDSDGITTTYDYDTAHRLVKITDALGNYVQYTLDAAGNKTAEQVYDNRGALHQSLSQTFNTLGQLTSVVDGLNHTVFNANSSSYDANGNLLQSSDALGIQRQLNYDALNRLVQTLDDYRGKDSVAYNATITYRYDSLDRLTQITDPSNLGTTYSYNGLSDATGKVSPDTGSTSRIFDAAGNVVAHTDANGITATNTYDALDRLTSTSYVDSRQNITYSYDDPNSTTDCSSSSPIGRLTRIIENTVTTVYCYDVHGNVIEKRQLLNGITDITKYGITAAGRLSSITYPSGTQVTYVRDGNGRIQAITATPPSGTTSTVVSGITYQPFGPISGYTLGNGQVIARTYDTNYRLTDLTSPAFNLHVARDAMGNIKAIGNAAGASPAIETYGYDALYRLTTVTDANGAVLEAVTYNRAGDRLTKAGSGLDTGAYSYNPGTHQLVAMGDATLTVDADGNTTAMTQAGSTYGFGYGARNRMTIAQLAGSTVGTYTYNGLNQRIQKVSGTTKERYDYNEGSQMLGEYGATNRDYIWMNDIPVANVDVAVTTSTIAYVTADQLGTPRAIADANRKTLWQNAYQSNPWNEQAPTSNGYVYNLGLPGQYFDQETGLYNNINRDYCPACGRYIESDPKGLFGGQLSTYAYAGGNPVNNTDPTGLIVKVVASDPVVAQTLMDAYAYLNEHSPTARGIDTDLENSSTVYKIEPTNNMDDDEYCPTNDTLGCEGHAHTVFVDICDFPKIPTTAGLLPITLPVLIGHELGHAWGYEDNNSPTDPLGDNVRMVENPIRQELGLPLRTRY